MEMLNDRCDKICDLLKRESERQQDIRKKQDDKKLTTAENEKIDFFEEEFNKKRAEIENDLNKLTDLNISELPDQFDAISKKILQIQKFVANSNIFLRVYDIKKCQEIINELSSKSNKLEEELLPKKKFCFRNRSKNAAKAASNSNANGKSDSTDEVDSVRTSKSYLPVKTCGFEKQTGKNLQLQRHEVFKNDVRLQDLKQCIVKIFGSPSTLHMINLEECTVLCGPVSTSVFADKCTNCTFVIACQQLRLHCSRMIEIYLHVTSRAIIEDSSDIFFAPYSLTYKGIEQDFIESQLDLKTNNWTAIDDFNWLSIDKPSPNWKFLEQNRRQRSWDM